MLFTKMRKITSFITWSKVLGPQEKIVLVRGYQLIECHLDYNSYNIRYFALDKINNITSDPHYVQWETTMFSNFAHKWIYLQRVTGFAYEKDEGQGLSISQSTSMPV